MKKEKVFCFDLDGTVTKQEILPLIAREIDLYEEMKVLTDATLKGLISLESSLKLRFKILSDIPLNVIQNVIANIKLNDVIVDFINNNFDHCVIITANMDLWIDDLKKVINCKFYTSSLEYDDNKIKSINLIDKGEVVNSLRSNYKKIISIGDGMGDVCMFEQSDIGIAFGGVHSPVSSLLEVSKFYVNNEEQLCRLLKML